MSASLRSPKPVGAREPVSGPGQVAMSERHPAAYRRRGRRELNAPSEPAERAALRRGEGRPSGRSATPGQRPAARDRQAGLGLDGAGGHMGQSALAVRPEQLSALVLPGHRSRPGARSGCRPGCRRGVAGVVVCVLALGVVACSVRDAKAEASVSASASASAAIARAEKGIADANASATASREAALTPELRAKRDAALAEPAPAKPSQMNEETPEGAASSVGYFLELYRYAFMTGNTTELAKMSEDRCVFCKSVIDDAVELHKSGGWANKWDQDVTNIRYYEKLEGYNYNLVHVYINYGQMTWCYPGKSPETADPVEGQELKFGVRYVNGRWMIGEGEVISK